MRVESRVLEYDSNVEGERVGMSIDESALSHIMSVLTDLYSDPEAAVLREYATNALDAHREANIARPIEVTTPTSLSPFVRIRDYGAGLDASDIRDVFSRYGTSTKRDSDDVVGMLGLGCKSALSYADQFTLTGTKDGIRTEVLVSRDEDGSGTMTIVESAPTSDPSGTEIVVPAKTSNRFAEKALDLFRFWSPGSVLVDGSAPDRIDGLWLSDTFLLTQDAEDDVVVMGNVPYPVPDEFSSRKRYGWSMSYRTVRFVEIGSVAFTPSREALQLTKRTKRVLESIAEEREALIASECAAKIANAKTPADAIRIQEECRAVGFKGKGTYQGREVPKILDRREKDANGNYRHTNAEESPSKSFLLAGSAYAKKNGSREWSSGFDLDVVFEGYTSKLLSPTKREKIAAWKEAEGLPERGRILLCERLSSTERYWLDGIRVVDWNVVDAIKLARADRPSVLAGGRKRGSYDAKTVGAGWSEVLADELPSSGLYWNHGNRYSTDDHSAVSGSMLPDGSTVVALPANRIERFRRDFPHAKSLDDAAREAAKAWTDGADADVVRAYVLQSSGRESEKLRGLDHTKILDPALREATRLANVETKEVSKALRRFAGFLPARFAERDEGESVVASYPLLESATYYGMRRTDALRSETVLYVNASYLARTKDAEASGKEGR